MQKVEIKLIDRKVAKARQTKWRPLSERLERTKTSINAKFDRFNENYQCINQCTSNWTFVQHKEAPRNYRKLPIEDFLSRQLVKKEDYKPELKSHISAHSHVTE